MCKPFKKRQKTPQEMQKWMAWWAIKRARGQTWFILESMTLYSFFFLFAKWLALLFRLDSFLGEASWDFWQPLLVGLFSGWIVFRENEHTSQRYLSELQRHYMTKPSLNSH